MFHAKYYVLREQSRCIFHVECDCFRWFLNGFPTNNVRGATRSSGLVLYFILITVESKDLLIKNKNYLLRRYLPNYCQWRSVCWLKSKKLRCKIQLENKALFCTATIVYDENAEISFRSVFFSFFCRSFVSFSAVVYPLRAGGVSYYRYLSRLIVRKQ